MSMRMSMRMSIHVPIHVSIGIPINTCRNTKLSACPMHAIHAYTCLHPYPFMHM